MINDKARRGARETRTNGPYHRRRDFRESLTNDQLAGDLTVPRNGDTTRLTSRICPWSRSRRFAVAVLHSLSPRLLSLRRRLKPLMANKSPISRWAINNTMPSRWHHVGATHETTVNLMKSYLFTYIISYKTGERTKSHNDLDALLL